MLAQGVGDRVGFRTEIEVGFDVLDNQALVSSLSHYCVCCQR